MSDVQSHEENQVAGCPEWRYGVIVRMSDRSVRFDLTNHETGQVLRGVVSRSPYRRTDTAKLMEGEHATGYEAVAQRAIERLADA